MPTTLADVREDVLDYINRPQAESQDRVDRAIRKACKFAQRKHQFVLAEDLIRIVYPANTLVLNVGDVLRGKIRDLISCHMLGSIDATTGKPLRILKYSELSARIRKYQQTHIYGNDIESESTQVISELTNLRSNSDYTVFLMAGGIGIYPVPTSDVNLLVGIHTWLADLTEDDDTNFLLDFCDDYIVLRSLYSLNTLLKTEGRNQINAVELAEAWETITTWDSQINNSPGETI